MTLSVAIQMDPVEGDQYRHRHHLTFLLMLEAQTRGHALWVYTADKLSLEDGRVIGRGRALNLRAVKGDHHTLGAYELRDMTDFDVVLMRQDPPFDMAYITATHLLGSGSTPKPWWSTIRARCLMLPKAVRHRVSRRPATDPDHQRSPRRSMTFAPGTATWC